MGKKDSTGEALGAEKKVRIRWPFPRATLEEALKSPWPSRRRTAGTLGNLKRFGKRSGLARAATHSSILLLLLAITG